MANVDKTETLDKPAKARTAKSDAELESRPETGARAEAKLKHINLALQGGGSHGAFTWGVLDRLLEDERIGIEGISATSAGAMNAAVVSYGMGQGGREAAREGMTRFWRAVSAEGVSSPLHPSPMDRLINKHRLDFSPIYPIVDIMTKLISPYQLNPMNKNPLRKILEGEVNCAELRKHLPIQLYLCATNVGTGKIKVFSGEEITIDAILASACYPFTFHAVEIDGEHYWDGGYMGNPALFPIFENCDHRDVVVVQINPIIRREVPKTAIAIMNRINEISFNSALLREMRTLEYVTKLIESGDLRAAAVKGGMRVHAIEADYITRKLTGTSKMNTDWEFLSYLFEEGRRHTQNWLDTNFDRIGVKSTIDIKEHYE